MINERSKFSSGREPVSTATDYNSQISQLAIECSYYEVKANECWEMLSRIDEQVKDAQEMLRITTAFHSSTYEFPIKFLDITVINQIIMALCTNYRRHYALAKQKLDGLKSASTDNCDMPT